MLVCFMLFMINKREVHFLVVFSYILRGQSLEMLQNSSAADLLLTDLQCQALIELPDCQHMVFTPKQSEYFGPTDTHNWERTSQQGYPEGIFRFCDHTVCLRL